MYIFLGIMLFSVALIVGLGIAVKHFQAYWLISGYNTMSRERKAKVNVVGLANFTGNMCYIMGAIMALATILIMLGQETWGFIAFGLFVPLTIYIVIKSQQFDSNAKNRDGSLTAKSKGTILAISALMVITFLGIGILLYFSSQPNNITISQQQLIISGFYGEKIPLSTIEELTLQEDLPKILMRTNGSTIGTKNKGYYKLEGIERAKLFLDTSKPPFIFLHHDGQLVIFNYDKPEETKAFYEKLMAEYKGGL
ncbi:MAG: DUF3784 domain-containing protein [Bacillota bacterium]